MADNKPVEMQATLGLTGLTMNAMALIAPGAFLWLTFFIQATAGNTTPPLWAPIFPPLLLCPAPAISYADPPKVYPSPGKSYTLPQPSFLNPHKHCRPAPPPTYL